MYPIDLVTGRISVLLNGFFKYQHRKVRLSVFLSGREPKDPHFDLRMQVKRLLETRMGCVPFLGEDIAELRRPRPNRNHLTIEVEEAVRSDLIVMFLGSPGTLSEVTAFVMNSDINPKLVVFNDSKYRDQVSFVNLGPLQLLPPHRLIYYDATEEAPSVDIVKYLDEVVANARFDRGKVGTSFPSKLLFEDRVALCLIYVSYPVRYQDLAELFPWGEAVLRKAPYYRTGYIAWQASFVYIQG